MSYRPLAGISCNVAPSLTKMQSMRYRPLAGISCNASWSLHPRYLCGYRPLAGISCNSKLHWKSAKIRAKQGRTHNTKLLYLFLPQKKRTFSGKRPDSGVRSGKPGGRQNARSAQNPPGGAEGAPAGRVFLVLLWAAYRIRTRMTAGMLLSFSRRRASTAPVASSMV